MKKKILLITILILTFLTGCGKTNLKEINYKELEEKVAKKESFILEVVQDGCTHCQEFSPKLDKILQKNNIQAFKINLSNMNEQDESKFELKYLIDGTPITLFFNEGSTSVMHRIEGNVNEEKIKEKLELNGYIKK